MRNYILTKSFITNRNKSLTYLERKQVENVNFVLKCPAVTEKLAYLRILNSANKTQLKDI